jgi:hypothetical protein
MSLSDFTVQNAPLEWLEEHCRVTLTATPAFSPGQRESDEDQVLPERFGDGPQKLTPRQVPFTWGCGGREADSLNFRDAFRTASFAASREACERPAPDLAHAKTRRREGEAGAPFPGCPSPGFREHSDIRPRPRFSSACSAPPRESFPTPPGVVVRDGTVHLESSAPSGRDPVAGWPPGLRPGLSPLAPLGQSVGPSVGSEVRRGVGSKVVDYPIFVSASGSGAPRRQPMMRMFGATGRAWRPERCGDHNVNHHIRKVLSDIDLQEDSVLRSFRITADDLPGVFPRLHLPGRLSP